jgi:outer membrane protein assembly factor BamE
MPTTLSRWVPAVSAALLCALLPACKSVEVPKVPGITPYRMVIQQGNFISQEMVAQLKPGMTKEQVRFVLGTPLVTDIFHADRWDYVFFREASNGKREQRNLSVIFENNKLARVLGDLMPSEGAVQAGGFDPLVKPEPAKPAAKPEAKPEAKAEAKPDSTLPPKAGADVAQPAAAPAGQNWGTTDWSKAAPEKQPEAPPAAKPEEPKAAEEAPKPGFFDRLREKIGL